ncbi:MAG: hypothetical protein ABS882_12955, partial [Lysinibacillus sp.]
MDINSIKKQDLFEKNTILMVVYGISAYLGGIAQFFLDRPIGIALSLFIPATINLGYFIAQRYIEALRPYFPFFAIMMSVIMVYGTIISFKVTLATIVLSVFILILSSIHNHYAVLVVGYIGSVIGMTFNFVLDTGNFAVDPANVYVTLTLMAVALYLMVRQNKKLITQVEQLMTLA